MSTQKLILRDMNSAIKLVIQFQFSKTKKENEYVYQVLTYCLCNPKAFFAYKKCSVSTWLRPEISVIPGLVWIYHILVQVINAKKKT